uniref:Uncharacterized protein n=1 Tax=Oryza punctata TaxID=4537 RepID=A0A0E0MDK4_ORYPU
MRHRVGLVADVLLYWAHAPAVALGVPTVVFFGANMFAQVMQEVVMSDNHAAVLSARGAVATFPTLEFLYVCQTLADIRVPFNDPSPPAQIVEMDAKLGKAVTSSHSLIINSFDTMEGCYIEHWNCHHIGHRVWPIGLLCLAPASRSAWRREAWWCGVGQGGGDNRAAATSVRRSTRKPVPADPHIAPLQCSRSLYLRPVHPLSPCEPPPARIPSLHGSRHRRCSLAPPVGATADPLPSVAVLPSQIGASVDPLPPWPAATAVGAPSTSWRRYLPLCIAASLARRERRNTRKRDWMWIWFKGILVLMKCNYISFLF